MVTGRISLALVVAAVLCCAVVEARRPLSSITYAKKKVPVPCVMKKVLNKDSFCFIQRMEEACTSYSAASYATYKECVADTQFGKTIKCADVPAAERSDPFESWKTCIEGEPGRAAAAAAAAPAAPAGWKVLAETDIPGADIRCQATAPQTSCQICPQDGLVTSALAACKATTSTVTGGQGCVAITWDAKTKCAWLKGSGSSTKARAGWTAYVPAAAAAAPAAPAGWKLTKDSDIVGADINCQATSAEKPCQVCYPTVAGALDACKQTTAIVTGKDACKAIVWNPKAKCATLKTSGGKVTAKAGSGLEVYTAA